MKTVLITGAAGYVGLNVAHRFASLGWEVVAVDNLSSPNASLNGLERLQAAASVPKVKIFTSDAGNVSTMALIVSQFKPKVVIHLAALCDLREGEERRSEYYRANVETTSAIIEAASIGGCGRLIFASSCSVYGEPAGGFVSESDVPNPSSHYGETKIRAEELIGVAVGRGDLEKATVVRPFNVIGRWRSRCNRPIRIVDRLIASIAGVAYKPSFVVDIFGDGSAVRDYIDAGDLAWLFHDAAIAFDEQGSRFDTFNAGSGVGRSVAEMIEAVGEVAGDRPKVRNVPAVAVEHSSITANIDKAASVLGWRPKASLYGSLRQQFNSWGEERNGNSER